MSTNNNVRFLSVATLALGLAAAAQSGMATEILTPVNPGNETSLASILNEIEASDGITLERVYDDKDEFWSLAGEGTVVTRARFAGYNNMFGFIQGTDGGVFAGLVPSLSSNGIAANGGTVTSFPVLSGEFRLAIRIPSGQIWSSLETDNSHFMDHMVTWVDAKDPKHYFVAFEDLVLPGGDGDFNDIVLELHNVVDGPQALASVPEPATLALTALGLAGLGYSRRSRDGSHGAKRGQSHQA